MEERGYNLLFGLASLTIAFTVAFLSLPALSDGTLLGELPNWAVIFLRKVYFTRKRYFGEHMQGSNALLFLEDAISESGMVGQVWRDYDSE